MVKKGYIRLLPEISKVKTKGQAQSLAVEWQQQQSGYNMSWSEAVFYSHYFKKLAKKFKLTKEFKENGII